MASNTTNTQKRLATFAIGMVWLVNMLGLKPLVADYLTVSDPVQYAVAFVAFPVVSVGLAAICYAVGMIGMALLGVCERVVTDGG